MKIEKLNRAEAEVAFHDWMENGHVPVNVSVEYQKLRKELVTAYNNIIKSLSSGNSRETYFIDLKMGLKVYELLAGISGFNLTHAADDDVWRYLTVIVAPEPVYKRWTIKNPGANTLDERFWKRGVRIWYRTIWRYIHLSWQGSSERTYELLKKEQFNSDIILNLTDRVGKEGTSTETAREIMKYYGSIPNYAITAYSRKLDGDLTLFRAVLKLHLAKSLIVDPCLYKGGPAEYVKSLFEQTGFILDEYL